MREKSPNPNFSAMSNRRQLWEIANYIREAVIQRRHRERSATQSLKPRSVSEQTYGDEDHAYFTINKANAEYEIVVTVRRVKSEDNA